MADVQGLYERHIEAAGLALGRGDRPAAVEALSAAIDTTRSDPALRREHVDALIRLATLKQELTQPAQAERLLVEALAVGERHFGKNHPELVVALNELSRLHVRQSAHARAEPLLERLLEIKRAGGEEHHEVATALAGLALVRRALGDDAAAEALYRRALQIREQVLAPNHMATVITLEQLSETCAARGKFGEALALLQRALPTRERALGAEHATVRGLRARIADLESKIPQDAGKAPNQLVFIYEPETPASRRASLKRDRVVTPPFSVAVAAASFMAAPAQLAVPQQPTATTAVAAPSMVRADLPKLPPFGASRAVHDVVAESGRLERSRAVASSVPMWPETRAPRYAPIAAAVVVIAIATFAASSYAANRRNDAAAPTAAEPRAAAVSPVPTENVVATMAAPALAAAVRADSARSVSVRMPSVTPAPKAPLAAPKSSAPVTLPGAPVALPTIAGVTIPTNVMANADSVMRASTRADRDTYTDQIAPTGKLRVSAYGEDRTETQPVLIGSAPQPRFPESLRAQRMEGDVVVRFLVDETGRVEPSSMKVVRSPHELFTAAVRNVLPKFRFEPARTAAPESKPRSEWVQYAIQFAAGK